jgi:lipopolysaccharide export LptBFGC system permease protein LptF
MSTEIVGSVAVDIDDLPGIARPEPRPAPVGHRFEMSFYQGRFGGVLFGLLAVMGVLLALFATPLPVVVAGWVVVALAGLMALWLLGRSG